MAGGRALLFAAIVIAGCNKSKAEDPATAPEVATVEKRDLDVTADASGLVEPIDSVEIKSKASGEVLSVNVQTGQEVTRGALLVAVEPRDVRNAYAQAEADLEVAKARTETSAANLKRVQELRKDNVATQQELETAVLDDANSRAALVKARVNLDLAQQRLGDVTIRAPLNGTVIQRSIEPGMIIASASGTFGGGTTLLTMADLSVVQVRALVDESDIGKVEAGQQARVTVEAYPGRTFFGQVMKVEPRAVVDQNVTMFPVLIQLRNDEKLLKPGMNTEVSIEIAHKTDAVVIPNDAVVAMRDATTAGEALGLTEQQMKDAMQKLRDQRMGGQAMGRSGGQADTTKKDSTQKQPAMSPECSALRDKARNGGFQNLSDADRAKMRTCFQGQGGGGGGRGGFGGGGFGGGRRRGNTRPGIVFVPGAKGPEPRMVMLGVNDWDYTEVVNGLKPGEKVFLMTAARLQQQQTDMQNRIRERSSMGLKQQSTPQGGQGGGPPR